MALISASRGSPAPHRVKPLLLALGPVQCVTVSQRPEAVTAVLASGVSVSSP